MTYYMPKHTNCQCPYQICKVHGAGLDNVDACV
jgi:hypothetical protein